MLKDILNDSEEFSGCRDLKIENDVCPINLIKLNSYDCIFTKKYLRLGLLLLGINN